MSSKLKKTLEEEVTEDGEHWVAGVFTTEAKARKYIKDVHSYEGTKCVLTCLRMDAIVGAFKWAEVLG